MYIHTHIIFFCRQTSPAALFEDFLFPRVVSFLEVIPRGTILDLIISAYLSFFSLVIDVYVARAYTHKICYMCVL